MIRSLTILTVMTTLVACGGVGDQNPPKKPTGRAAVSAEESIKIDGADSFGLKKRTFVVANQRPMVEKVAVVNSLFAGIPLPGQKLESAEESIIQSVTSTGLRDTFALAGKPSIVSKFKVFFGDVEQPESSFIYNASLNSIILKNPPAQYTQVRVRYQEVTGIAIIQGAVAKLSHTPEKGSIKITNSNCDSTAGIQVEGDVLIFKCGAVGIGTEQIIEYVYVDPNMQIYDMKDVTTPEAGVWEVKVNGKIYDTFSRQSTTISILESLPLGAKVEISFKLDRTVGK